MISRSGSWSSKAEMPLVALEPDERERNRAAGDEREQDHERRPGGDRGERARTRARRRRSGRRTRPCGAAGRPARACAGASASASSARTPPRSRGRGSRAARAARAPACASRVRSPGSRCGASRLRSRSPRAAASANVPASRTSRPTSSAISGRARLVEALGEQGGRPRAPGRLPGIASAELAFPAAVERLELEPLAGARGGRVLEPPRALELARDAGVDRAQLPARAGAAVGAARGAGERLERRRVEPRALDRDHVHGDAGLAGDARSRSRATRRCASRCRR